VEAIAELPGVCVAGNHDLIATDRLPPDGISDMARVTLAWTGAALTAASRDWLCALPATAALDGIVVAHGSVGDARCYVTTDERARAELERFAMAFPGASLLILGHTHHATAFGERSGRVSVRGESRSVEVPRAERWLLNPGAVGQSRERAIRARVAVLDVDARQVSFRSLPYDVDATRRALDHAGLPASAVRFRPRRQLLRAALRRLRSRA
jgi:predicted phosphodiesterase